MALSADAITQQVIHELNAAGFETEHPNCVVTALARAVANAVVTSITNSAEVKILSGSSKGTYKVE